MPRYYFHLTDGKQVLNNHKGIDLSGNAAARADALTFARDLKHGAVMPGWNWTGWFVTIVDRTDTRLMKCRLPKFKPGGSALVSNDNNYVGN